MTDKEKREKAIKKLNEIGKIVAFLKTDDETYSAGEIHFFSALLQQPQPSAGEFVKETREWVESFKYNWPIKNISWPKKLLKACDIITAQAQTIAEQGIRLDTVNRIGKEACEELDQLQNENTEQAAALNPIREWYRGDNRSDLEILTDAIADLQKDRAKVLEQAEDIKKLEETTTDQAEEIELQKRQVKHWQGKALGKREGE